MSKLQLTQEKLDALRSEYKTRRPCALLKYPRPKTKPEYPSIYPWIILDETDPHFVFCAICECRLSAKRSDLGKHEGSIKHSENAQRKAVCKVKAEHPDEVKWEFNEDCDERMLPLLQFASSNDLCKVEEADDEADREADAEGDDDDDDDDDEDEEGEGEGIDDAEGEDDANAESGERNGELDVEYEPDSKRRVSETDSQQSGMLDYLPLQVTINEFPHAQLTPAGQLPTTTAAAGVAQPCRITIKKVTAPLSKAASTSQSAGQTHEITSKATITPIATGCYTPSQRQQHQQLPSYLAGRQINSYHHHLTSMESRPRDSLDLFFDSICATVKGLPPKLATEGKIRVMQLIGELELRAINETETQPASNATVNHPAEHGSAAADGAPLTDAHGSSQQIETVASTTK